MKPDSYFIAVTAPGELAERVQQYRDLATPYSNFKTPLHITIIPPFYLESTEEGFIKLLENSFTGLGSQKITLDTIAYFEHRSSVVYLKPDEESEIFLKKLFGAISTVLYGFIPTGEVTVKRQFNTSMYPEDMRPHLTLAKRVPLNKLGQMKKVLEKFSEIFVFTVTGIDIYKQSNSFGTWMKIKEIPLFSNPINQLE
jgi:2'-5' RNA ligase